MRRLLLPVLLSLALPVLLAFAVPLAAQVPKDVMLANWERSKANLIAYVDVAPDSALAFRPTRGVRNYAEQIDHIVSTNALVAAQALGRKASPPAADTAKYLHDKAALKAYVTSTYDYVLAAVREAKPATMTRKVSMFEMPSAPAWQWMEMAREHGAWTLGQLVPYLRMNGVTPPSYQMPF